MARFCNLVAIFLISVCMLDAQRMIDEVQSLSGVDQVSMEIMWADVEIRKSTDGQLHVEGKVSINQGESNDAFDLDISQSGDILVLKSDIKDRDKLPRYATIYKNGREYYFRIPPGKDFDWTMVPDSLSKENNGWTSIGIITDISLTISIPEDISLSIESTHGDVKLSDINNEMEVESIHGSIDAVFDQIDPEHAITLSSIHNHVDVSVPVNARADFELKTSWGEMFTNLDLDYGDEDVKMKNVSRKRVVGKFNGGGVDFNITSTHNNIYLRKKS